MNETQVYVCRVDAEDGIKDYVTILPPEVTIAKGLAPEAIVGMLLRPLAAGESIVPDNFARNRAFVEFMHKVIAMNCANQPACRAEATRMGNGWIFVIDQRTQTPGDRVPPEDIIGVVEAKDGQVLPETYRPSPNHRILTDRGFFVLESSLQQDLLRELAALEPT